MCTHLESSSVLRHLQGPDHGGAPVRSPRAQALPPSSWHALCLAACRAGHRCYLCGTFKCLRTAVYVPPRASGHTLSHPHSGAQWTAGRLPKGEPGANSHTHSTLFSRLTRTCTHTLTPTTRSHAHTHTPSLRRTLRSPGPAGRLVPGATHTQGAALTLGALGPSGWDGPGTLPSSHSSASSDGTVPGGSLSILKHNTYILNVP